MFVNISSISFCDADQSIQIDNWISGKKQKQAGLVVKYILLNWKKAIGAFFNDRKLASDFTTTLGPSINYVVSK